MNRPISRSGITSLAAVFVVGVVASGCQQTTVAVQTQAPPGFVSEIDTTTMTLRMSQGLASVLECTTSLESYYGPCLDLDVDVSGDAIDVFDAHLDAAVGQNVGGSANDDVRVTQPPTRAALAIAAAEEGESVLTISSNGPEVTLTVVVVPAPSFD